MEQEPSFSFLQKLVATILFLIAAAMPVGGLLLGAALVSSLVLTALPLSGLVNAIAIKTLIYGGVTYGVLTVYAYFTFVVWNYNNCCVGFNTFKGHLRESISVRLKEVVAALLWTYTVFGHDRMVRNWGMGTWWNDALMVFDFFFLDKKQRERTQMDVIDFETGEYLRTSITPENAMDEIGFVLRETLGDKDEDDNPRLSP